MHHLKGVHQVLAVEPTVGNVHQIGFPDVRASLVSGISASRHTCTQDVWVDHDRKHDLGVGCCARDEVLVVRELVFQRFYDPLLFGPCVVRVDLKESEDRFVCPFGTTKVRLDIVHVAVDGLFAKINVCEIGFGELFVPKGIRDLDVPFPGDLVLVGFLQERRDCFCNVHPTGQVGGPPDGGTVILPVAPTVADHIDERFAGSLVAIPAALEVGERVIIVEHVIDLVLAFGGGIGPFARYDAAVYSPSQRIGKFQPAIFGVDCVYANDLRAIGVHQDLHECTAKLKVIAKGFGHVFSHQARIGKHHKRFVLYALKDFVPGFIVIGNLAGKYPLSQSEVPREL